jgi:hypothetical protein
MDTSEHVYGDDPADGHPDVRTRLAKTDYYFLGNGHVLAAVQHCRSGEGTPLGLLILHPDRFGPKRASLTCDPKTGLEGTRIRVRVGETTWFPTPTGTRVRWDNTAKTPTVRALWEAGTARVEERFGCPHPTLPRVVREITFSFCEPRERTVALVPGNDGVVTFVPGIDPPAAEGNAESGELGNRPVEPGPLVLDFAGAASATARLIHEIRCVDGEYRVVTRWDREAGSRTEPDIADVADFRDTLATFRSSDEGLNHLFMAARRQLPVAVDHRGRMDGSIWQYNLEWVRDQSHVAEALVRLGDAASARTMLARLLDEMVSPEGDTVDSGRRRAPDEVELDQNGELLAALATYVDWTGDPSLVESRWERVRALAAFPLRSRFRHAASGLLHNRREYWERHAAHGIEDGFELTSQLFVCLGLQEAARLADALGHVEDRDRWRDASASIRNAMLDDPRWRLVEEGHFIKRRGVDGAWQRTVCMEPDPNLPDGIPLLAPGDHFLDPDTETVLPIVHGMVAGDSELARNTLAWVEQLWNQAWDDGGYGRYHVTGEPDSPGAWPFASLFVARAYAEARDDAKVWRILRWLEETRGGEAGAWFENHGPRFAPPFPQVGIVPWTWAELASLVVHHLLGVRPDRTGVTLRPWLLAGLTEMEASLRVGEHRLHLAVRRAASPEERGMVVEGKRLPWGEAGVRIPRPESDVRVDISCQWS